jgi:hypothetical protein
MHLLQKEILETTTNLIRSKSACVCVCVCVCVCGKRELQSGINISRTYWTDPDCGVPKMAGILFMAACSQNYFDIPQRFSDRNS